MRFTSQAEDLLDGLVSLAREYRSDACLPHLLYILMHKDDVRFLIRHVIGFDALLARVQVMMEGCPKIKGQSKKSQLLLDVEILSAKVCKERGGSSITLMDLFHAILIQGHEPIIEGFLLSSRSDCFGIYDIQKAIMKLEGRTLNNVFVEEDGGEKKKLCEYCKSEMPASSKESHCKVECEIAALVKQHEKAKKEKRKTRFSDYSDMDNHYGYYSSLSYDDSW